MIETVRGAIVNKSHINQEREREREMPQTQLIGGKKGRTCFGFSNTDAKTTAAIAAFT